MRKLILTLVAICLFIPAFAQLQTRTIEEYAKYKEISKSSSMTIGASYYVRWINGLYYLLGETSNRYTKTCASKILGVTKESAIQTIKDLKELKKTIGNQTLVVEGLEKKATKLRKDNWGGVIFSTDGVAGVSYCLTYLKVDKIIEDILAFEEPEPEKPEPEQPRDSTVTD